MTTLFAMRLDSIVYVLYSLPGKQGEATWG